MSLAPDAGEALSPVDRQIGRALRTLRISQGLSQVDLASRLGLRADDIERYEQGETRIEARRLIDLSKVLGVSINAFWGGVRDGDADE